MINARAVGNAEFKKRLTFYKPDYSCPNYHFVRDISTSFRSVRTSPAKAPF